MDELARFSDGHLGARVGNARLRAVLDEAMSEQMFRAGAKIVASHGAVAVKPWPQAGRPLA